VHEIPQKEAYKISEVCNYTDTQPYILRFWESEFPQLNPERRKGGPTAYTRRDLDLVLRIKRLLYDDELTIAGARECLEQDSGSPRSRGKSRRGEESEAQPEMPQRTEPQEPEILRNKDRQQPATGSRPTAAQPQFFGSEDGVSRERYEGALEEISHLRLKLREAESRSGKTELALKRAEQAVEAQEQRSGRAAQCIEALLERLTSAS
jgi:DNA-binding transcriptional MerR regulator